MNKNCCSKCWLNYTQKAGKSCNNDKCECHTTMENKDIQIDFEKQRTDSEFAIFFNEVEKNLPKTPEMFAVGHEKIVYAMYPAYIVIRNHILLTQRKELRESISKLKREEMETYCEEQMVDRGFNQAISEILSLLEEK